MAKPWKKRWPYVGKDGRKTYHFGFRDHDGRQCAKAFPSAKLANEWAEDYVSAERRGLDSLRRFLLDLDAKEANGDTGGQAIGEVIQLYFAFNAPEAADGLATSTFHTYRHAANRHLLGMPGASRGKDHQPAEYAVRFAAQPAVKFNEPAAPRAWREEMKHAEVGSSARAHAWRVLSAVLSWAANSALVPEIETNGCLLANEKISNRRKSMRGMNGRSTMRRRGEEVRSWALSPMAVELIRAQMLSNTIHPTRPILGYRDAVMLSVQFGLGLRNQEVYGLRWSSFADQERTRITEVLSWDELDDCGKTEHATGRTARTPSLLVDDLALWRALLRQHGHPARDVDFIVPGDLVGQKHGVRDPDTGACHMNKNQAEKWGPRCMKPAVAEMAESNPAFANVVGATPYSLRRGGISARLRGENAQSVADQCGTSLEMLSQHYSYEIDDFDHQGPQPLDQQWRKARAAVLAQQRQDEQLAEAA
jgi:integrase